MDLHVILRGGGDLAGQIYRQIRAAILDGSLSPGDALPPSRLLAQRLSVSRNTVTAAYDRLTAEGLLVSRVGAGTFVAPVTTTEQRSGRDPTLTPVQPLAGWSKITAPGNRYLGDRPTYDLRSGLPDIQLFPFDRWRKLTGRHLRVSSMGAGMHIDPAGLWELRTAIARHVAAARAVSTTADEVIVTQGIQQGLDLLARAMLGPGDCVVVEEPGYPTVRELFRSHQADVVAVPVDSEGLRVDALPDHARIVYITPSHQYPLGMPMSLERRMSLLEWARQRAVVIAEDDYDSEFRFGNRAVEPLYRLDDSGRVLYFGTFSKVMYPTLRLGFVVAPQPLRKAIRKAKFVTDWHSPQVSQAALAEFIDSGLLARHVRRMRREYERRHDLILELLDANFADNLSVIPSVAGIHLSAWMKSDVDAVTVARVARTRGISILPLSFFRTTPGADGLVFGYGALPWEKVPPALQILRAVIDRSYGSPQQPPLFVS